MSTVYNLEPQPTAKVLLHTTSGDVSLELFAQQTPLTSRNFLQHCLDSYYDNTIFHRLVPGFIIQGGDPTGTGHGGESSFDGGAPFEDEFHSRLKFNRRGLLGMANTGVKNDNGSQFFLTLGKTEELTGRNTMFGRVVGDTIYNLVKMGETELTEEEGSERPMYPTRITATEVLVNPFEDMVARVKQTVQKIDQKQPLPKKKSVKKKAAKTLLSFGNDEGDDADIAPITAAKFNPKLINSEPAMPAGLPSSKRSAPDTSSRERPSKRRASRSPVRAPKLPPTTLSSSSKPQPAPKSTITPSETADQDSSSASGSESDSHSEPDIRRKNNDLLTATTAQIEALKSSLKRETPQTNARPAHKKSALESLIPEGSIRGRKKPRGGASSTSLSRDELRTLDSFKAFKKRLEGAAPSSERNGDGKKNAQDVAEIDSVSAMNANAQVEARGKTKDNPDRTNGGPHNTTGTGDADEEAALCDLHFIANCQSCSKWEFAEADGGGEAADSDDNDVGWMGKQLTFAKDRLGKDLEWKRQNEQDLVVIDPKEKAREIKEGKKREKKGREGKIDKR